MSTLTFTPTASGRQTAAEVVAYLARFDALTDPRQSIRSALRAHIQRQHGARILDEQMRQRTAEREADAEAKRQNSGPRSALAAATGPVRVDSELLKAKRRAAYDSALSYRMAPAEVLAACRAAVQSIGADWQRDDCAHDAIGALVLRVIERHGRQPIRAKVGRVWLQKHAQRIYDRETERREHRTGLRASAGLAKRWAAADRDSDSGSDGSGPDPVYRQAARQPAPAAADALSPADAIAALERAGCILTQRQRDALALTLKSAQRVTLSLSGAERKAAADALTRVRRAFPDPLSVRYAFNRQRAMLAAIDRCALSLEPARTDGTVSRNYPGAGWRFTAGALMVEPAARVKRQPIPLPLPDLGRFPLAVALSGGPRWRPVQISADPRQPLHGGPIGPRPHRAAAGAGAGALSPAADPRPVDSGWGFIQRQRTYPTRYRGIPRGPLAVQR